MRSPASRPGDSGRSPGCSESFGTAIEWKLCTSGIRSFRATGNAATPENQCSAWSRSTGLASSSVASAASKAASTVS
ncbi:hypothetical protein ACI1US_02413 [Leucobacter sp. BZR 635]